MARSGVKQTPSLKIQNQRMPRANLEACVAKQNARIHHLECRVPQAQVPAAGAGALMIRLPNSLCKLR